MNDRPPDRPDPDRPGARAAGGPGPERLGWTDVLRGVISGLVLSGAAAVMLGLGIYSTVGDTAWVAWAWLLLPMLGLVVLLVPRWRRAGSGFVLGLAVGSIIFAGLCGGWVAWTTSSPPPGAGRTTGPINDGCVCPPGGPEAHA